MSGTNDYQIELVATDVAGNRSSQGITVSVTNEILSDSDFDFGDAPASYELSADGPAAHGVVTGGPYLGERFEFETTPSTSDDATGDGAEEDGVTFPFELFTTATADSGGQVDVSASSAALLDGWLDFNGDGDFDDANEQIATSRMVDPGLTRIEFRIPRGSVAIDTFARFRISTSGNLNPTGPAADGEVEDYRVTLNDGESAARRSLVLPSSEGQFEISTVDGAIELTLDGNTINRLPVSSVAELIIKGTSGPDDLVIQSLPRQLDGLATVQGGFANDHIRLDAVAISVQIEGGVGLDTLSGGSGADTIIGGPGDNLLIGNGGDDRLEGGRGRDTLQGSGGNDMLLGQDARDFLSGGEGDDRLIGGGSADAVTEFGNVDFVITGDRLTGLGNNRLQSIESARLSSGGDSNHIDASAFPYRVSLFGGMGNDTLVGGAGNDLIRGGGGRDWVEGGAGSDRLYGDGGSGDTIRGGTGKDTLSGGAGVDVLLVSRAGDFLLSNDRLNRMGDWTRGKVLEPNSIPSEDIENAIFVGSSGDEIFIAHDFSGSVSLFGMDGNDMLIGGRASDVIVGGNGNDVLDGGAGDDRVDGNAGDDSIAGGDGDNTLSGGDGIDQLGALLSGIFELTAGQLKPVGETTGPLNLIPNEDIELAQLRTQSGFNAIDASEFPGSVTMLGGSGRDILVGTVNDDVLDGGRGDDGLDGLGGDDLLDGGRGNDTIFGDAGNDTINGGDGDDLIDGDYFENLTLSDNGNSDLIDGGAGRDTLWGGPGEDTLDGGDRDDLLIGRSGIDVLSGEEGSDTLVGGSGIGPDAGDTFDDLSEIDETFSFDWFAALPSA